MKTLEQVKAESRKRLIGFGYDSEVVESVLADYVSVKSNGIVMIKERIAGKENGRLTELYI